MPLSKKFLVIAALCASLSIAACGNDNSVPAATDYSKTAHWMSLPATVKKVDVFYLYPTTYKKVSAADPDISDINNAVMRGGASVKFARQATVFETIGNIYAPYYRQADAPYVLNLPTLAEREQVIAGAPTIDAVAAFDYYIKQYNNGRPYILVGHSQGANVLMNILTDYMKANPAVYDRMIAAYVVGYSVTDAGLAKNPKLKFATGPDDTGVVISYNTQSPNVAAGINQIVTDGALAINPITWTRDETVATVSQGLGSFVPINGVYTQATQYADAAVDKAKGVVICSTCDEAAMHAASLSYPVGVYHSFDYDFYYFNLRANAADRVARFLSK